MTHTLLIADDDPVQRKTLSLLLTKKLGYEVIVTTGGKEAIARIQDRNVGEISAVLLDIMMPEVDGFEVLAFIRKYRPDLPVIMLTGSDDTNIAVKAIKDGASDFIVKPPNPAQLDVAVKNAIRMSNLSRELAKVKRDKEGALAFSDIVGHHAGLAEAVAYGRKAAASSVPVLLIGESGAGKELLARAIHGESKRVGGPFVSANCNGMSESMIESLLRKAELGTLFLDDVNKMPQEAQVRLLRLLQHKELETAQGAKPARVNVRIIAACEGDLMRDVQAGMFREDLYFRLNILPIRLLPLRERTQDIIPIANYFIDRISASEGLRALRLSKDAEHYLTTQRWAGNVRELENVIHRALVLSDDEQIEVSVLTQIYENTLSPAPTERRATPALHVNLRQTDGSFKTMEQLEAEAMRMALAFYEDNITKAADALGIAKSTFYRKMKDV